MRKTLLTKKAVDDVLQKGLPIFFTLILLATLMNVFQGYFAHHYYRMGDWLINYQGGMVRRGILGELIYQVSTVSRVNPGILVVILQMFFYSLFFSYTYKLLKKQDSLIPFVLLLLSPFILSFQINDHLGGGRKEIIYFAILSYVVWSASIKETKTFEKIFYLILTVIYPLAILSHEMLALFMPYLLVVYLSSTKMNRKKYILLSVSLIPSLISLIAAIYYSGTPAHATEIFASIAKLDYPISGGAIDELSSNFTSALKRINTAYSYWHILSIVLVLALSVIAYRPVFSRIKKIIDSKLNLFLILLSIMATIALSFIALDWGRFIYIHLVSIFLLLFIKKANQGINSYDYDQPFFLSKPVVISIILYATIWRIYHVGTSFSILSVINPVATVTILIFLFKYKLQAR